MHRTVVVRLITLVYAASAPKSWESWVTVLAVGVETERMAISRMSSLSPERKSHGSRLFHAEKAPLCGSFSKRHFPAVQNGAHKPVAVIGELKREKGRVFPEQAKENFVPFPDGKLHESVPVHPFQFTLVTAF